MDINDPIIDHQIILNDDKLHSSTHNEISSLNKSPTSPSLPSTSTSSSSSSLQLFQSMQSTFENSCNETDSGSDILFQMNEQEETTTNAQTFDLRNGHIVWNLLQSIQSQLWMNNRRFHCSSISSIQNLSLEQYIHVVLLFTLSIYAIIVTISFILLLTNLLIIPFFIIFLQPFFDHINSMKLIDQVTEVVSVNYNNQTAVRRMMDTMVNDVFSVPPFIRNLNLLMTHSNK